MMKIYSEEGKGISVHIVTVLILPPVICKDEDVKQQNFCEHIFLNKTISPIEIYAQLCQYTAFFFLHRF